MTIDIIREIGMDTNFQATVFEDNSAEYACLSNKFETPITIDEQQFFSVEQYMLYRQAIIFGDEEATTAILACKRTKTLAKIKIRKIAADADACWCVERNIALYKALCEKFKVGGHYTYLRKTMGEIIYFSDDMYLGATAPLDENNRFSRNALQGDNMLGKTLTYIRKQRNQELCEQLLWCQTKKENE